MPAAFDRYAGDVLAARPAAPELPTVAAEHGLVIEEESTGWCGAVVGWERTAGMTVVRLEDRHRRTRAFPLGPGFLLAGRPVRLVAPPEPPRLDRTTAGTGGTAVPGRTAGGRGAPGSAARGPAAPDPTTRSAAPPGRTASGSVAVPGARARVARASRILVEGRHDAELVERVWGDDLRLAGVVVEALDGVEDLVSALTSFQPGPGRRLGVLVDHLVAGSKEWREAEAVARTPGLRGHVLVVGHPYVDVWQAVRPQRLGLDAWPVVPRGRPWKQGVLAALGWPCADAADIGRGWRRILGRVESWTDLEPELLGRVEELIDFVTGDAADR